MSSSSVFRCTGQRRIVDFGDFRLRRSLPTRATRAVGRRVLVDHFGLHTFPAGHGADVIPHPHINLPIVICLFDRRLEHHDSIGTVSHDIHGLQLRHALPSLLTTTTLDSSTEPLCIEKVRIVPPWR